MPIRLSRARAAAALSFAALIVIGLNAGAAGVLIPSQQADYHADKSTIGLLFFAFSAGYVLSGTVNGLLIRWLGARGQLALGGLVLALGALGSALRPPFPVLTALALVLAFGAGVLDAGFNAFVAGLPGHTSLLNLLHACFGVGALIGPLLAALLFRAGLSWPAFYLILAPLGALVAAGSVVLLPGPVAPGDPDGEPPASVGRALRRAETWLATGFLFGYVGVEATVGNWGYSYLTQHRGQAATVAAWVVSGYWLGITLGRFLVSAISQRLGIGVGGMMSGMVVGICLAAVFVWVAPGGVLVCLGLVLLGVFLGPIFPTMIALMPRLTPASLVPTSIGLLVGLSVLGGSVLPWGAGTLAQHLGFGSFPPYVLFLGLLCVLGWWSIARRLGSSGAAPTGPATLADAAELAARADQPLID